MTCRVCGAHFANRYQVGSHVRWCARHQSNPKDVNGNPLGTESTTTASPGPASVVANHRQICLGDLARRATPPWGHIIVDPPQNQRRVHVLDELLVRDYCEARDYLMETIVAYSISIIMIIVARVTHTAAKSVARIRNHCPRLLQWFLLDVVRSCASANSSL